MTGRGWLGFLLAIFLVGGGVLAWIRFEGEVPSIDGPTSLVVGGNGRSATLEVSDGRSGLREIRVSIVHAGGEAVVLEKIFPGNFGTGGTSPGLPERVEVRIDPAALGIGDGDATLTAVARDWSWRNRLRGNETELEVRLRIDLKKPRIAVASGLTYVERGGSGAVVYSIGEATVRDGVQVGEAFFRGYPAPGEELGSGRHIAIFAVPTDAPLEATIQVVAEDPAGNVGRASWPVVLKERVLPEANLTLPQRFLDTVVRNLAAAEGIPQDDLNSTFDKINTELRASNEAQIAKIVANSSESQLWEGAFSQLQNSKVTSRFAEHRTYFVDGQRVSQATHFGYDLASTAGAPIEASNSGRVVFSDDLGIYGNCVIVDHGFGLFSLYAHLSRIDVAVGDRVEKNAELGLSGATGLAGGDHLHFALIVGGAYVNPLEWWDPLWVRTHIDARLAQSAP